MPSTLAAAVPQRASLHLDGDLGRSRRLGSGRWERRGVGRCSWRIRRVQNVVRDTSAHDDEAPDQHRPRLQGAAPWLIRQGLPHREEGQRGEDVHHQHRDGGADPGQGGLEVGDEHRHRQGDPDDGQCHQDVPEKRPVLVVAEEHEHERLSGAEAYAGVAQDDGQEHARLQAPGAGALREHRYDRLRPRHLRREGKVATDAACEVEGADPDVGAPRDLAHLLRRAVLEARIDRQNAVVTDVGEEHGRDALQGTLEVALEDADAGVRRHPPEAAILAPDGRDRRADGGEHQGEVHSHAQVGGRLQGADVCQHGQRQDQECHQTADDAEELRALIGPIGEEEVRRHCLHYDEVVRERGKGLQDQQPRRHSRAGRAESGGAQCHEGLLLRHPARMEHQLCGEASGRAGEDHEHDKQHDPCLRADLRQSEKTHAHDRVHHRERASPRAASPWVHDLHELLVLCVGMLDPRVVEGVVRQVWAIRQR
mmetsp:Transcript_97820/g.273862  ORF Transcript_97820/g.273862 Transcript_97820/m.273862 type:complete len:481 (+) Transcript_97820:276-1718(+)